MSETSADTPAPTTPTDFIRDIVAADIEAGRTPQIVTRFPPEPNGYLHLGHAKSICLNFGIALENNGRCNLRFDDTNPTKEEVEYVDSITTDVRWLIGDWADQVLGEKPKGAKPTPRDIDGKPDFLAEPAAADSAPTDIEPFFASDYFEQLYTYAEQLILKGKAFVCDLTPEETDAYRGPPTEPGRESPYRNRSIEENLDLFRRMRAGEFPDSARTLRAKIDMASPNVWLRDPLLYRIRHVEHHHAGAGWCVYPLYDFAHCLSDYLEGITHSICTLEFVVHRPLYDWILEALELPRHVPHQYEFAKLNLAYTLFSKRRLMRLVQEKHVAGWDDPRMPTLAGLRRRGVPAAAVRNFAYRIGITKFESVTEAAVFEGAIRDELNTNAERRLAVLNPLKVVLTNIAPGESYACEAGNHPQNDALGSRTLQLTREVYIEADDFAEVPPPKFRRLKPGGSIRLKYGCIIDYADVVKDADGNVVEVHCTADLSTRRGEPNADRKVKGTVHWVSADDAIDATVRLYDRLFTVAEPGAEEDFTTVLNPESLVTVEAKLEPALAAAQAGECFQFERMGYFAVDPKDSAEGKPVFNRTITLRDTWSK
ncbi:glutamine--tRNA ligase [Actomonas aquatica]|uniref:Glutamine--tRNA ligase n=1 Tax=Actomonas aquatica TaxID=2866162 RepID=A0ABZ1C9J3_9BACT|nr:glutamine--tRNA ligase [Opitutus sp. WL0086]WRQ88141.1 glutamine--tRNA ligase [Opitutus sp. WL0086]